MKWFRTKGRNRLFHKVDEAYVEINTGLRHATKKGPPTKTSSPTARPTLTSQFARGTRRPASGGSEEEEEEEGGAENKWCDPRCHRR